MSKELRNPECNKCTLSMGCDFICDLATPTASRDLMVIGDHPSDSPALLKLMPMREDKFDLFWTVAKRVCYVDEARVYATYLAKCNPGDKKPKEEQYTTCAATYIKKEIMAVRPKAVLLLGVPVAAAFGFGDSVAKLSGQTKDVVFGKGDDAFTVTFIATYSPSYVSYNDALLKKFAYDIDKAWKTATGIGTESDTPTKVKMCKTVAEVEQVIEYIKTTGYCVPDFESTKLTDMNVFDPNFKATMLAVSFQHGSAYTIPLFHKDSPLTPEEAQYVLELFATEVWGNPDIHKLNQNIKFDMRVQQRYTPNVKFAGKIDCTMVMHSLFDDLSKHGIKEWLPTFIPKFQGWENDVKGKYGDDVPLTKLSLYAGIDCDAAFRGFTLLTAKLLEDQRVYDLYRNLYSFAMRPLLAMEMRGMPIDRPGILKSEARSLELIAEQTIKMNKYVQVRNFNRIVAEQAKAEKLAELRASKAKAIEGNRLKYAEKVHQKILDLKSGKITVYDGINFGSPEQLCGLLYSKDGFGFKLPYDKKSREPKAATGEVVVKGLGDKTGFIQDLLVLRSLRSTYSKYLKGIRIQLDENDCVHTTYNQAVVKTGRVSSGGRNSGINMQNVVTHVKIKHPFVEEVTVMPKKAFIVPDGYTMLNGDQSQAELRMMAEFAEEDKMIAAYNADLDLHILTACNISNITMEQFSALPKDDRDSLRQKAKSANFGLIYGQSAEGFRDYAENKYGVVMSLAEATRTRDAFFAAYPKILDYHEQYIARCRKFGYVRSLFGRRAHYPDVVSPNSLHRGNAERELINMPIQGSNGENTIYALSLLYYRLPASVQLLNTVHDSVMLLVPNRLVPYTAKIVVETCEHTPMLRYFGKEMKHLGMKTDLQFSFTNWKELKNYTEESWRTALSEIK